MLVFCFKDSQFRSSPSHLTAGIGIGLCVAAGWGFTGLASDEFASALVQPTSLTYVRPSGDTLEFLMRYTALGLPGFGVASVFGAIAGGVFALGCTVGQALTGMSTLAAGSLITFIFIVIGGGAGVKYLEWQIMREA